VKFSGQNSLKKETRWSPKLRRKVVVFNLLASVERYKLLQ
jgi:hypothetical protein